ncbi:AAA family ATPase [Hyphomonas pacifica]|uniref:Rad50/SbcC-type AAA domain-containing protein n=1 Tax=Hyphomonas pacifica TaxID=1280941 RepID=A0A062U370_9PROT|nr:AAA family ATPase [Hyphomonas pacifica]KCZ52158.1 hypothetical protein HY2_09080 [Hyphomonas pacifica]RAN35012.1 hypothetical protein HY3_09210 [Hyphomonas pacifica]
MKLRALRVRNVGPFGEQGCALEGLSDGLNVIRERNEAGKSTLFTALQIVLFEKHSSTKSALKEFRHDRGSGAPFIEIDLEVDTRTYRISKQYLSAASAVVTDALTNERLSEKRDAEDWIAQLIGGDKPDDGPSGMLWIRQGDPYLQPKPEGSAGEALFSVLEGQVDTVMGGQRAARVLERAEKRLAEIVSTKQMNPKGAFKDAIGRLDELEGERSDFAVAVQQSEADRERLLSVLKERDALTSEDDEKFAKDLAEARKELEAAEGASEKIRGLQSEVGACETTLKAAENALERYSSDLASAEKLRASIQDKQSAIESITETIEEGEAPLDDLRQQAASAETALKQARKDHQDALSRDKRRREIAQRRSLTKALERAKDLASQLKAAEKEAGVSLPDLSDLEDANQDILTFEAQARVARPELTVEKSNAPVLLDGEAIGDTGSVRLSGKTKLNYQDLELLIDTPDVQGAEEKLAKATERLESLLESCGAKDISDARRLHEERNSAQQSVERLKNDLSTVAPNGIATLENELAALPDDEEEDDEPGDLDALARASELSEEELTRIVAERDTAAEGIQKLRNQVTILETQIEGLESQLSDLDTVLGADDKREERRTELSDAVVEARRRWREAEDRLETAERDRPSLDGAQARVKRLEAAAQNRSEDRLRLSKAEGELRGRLAQAGQEGASDKLAAVEAEITRWQERISAFEEERDALILLVGELSKARASRRTKFFAPVRQAVDPLLSMVLGSASLAYDDRLGPDELERNGMREKLTRLSGGTREQIAVLTRLGFAQVMAGKDRHIPIVLDDALVYSDDERIQKLFDVINVVAADVQIIAFSCRQKTFEALGGKTIHPVDFPVLR